MELGADQFVEGHVWIYVPPVRFSVLPAPSKSFNFAGPENACHFRASVLVTRNTCMLIPFLNIWAWDPGSLYINDELGRGCLRKNVEQVDAAAEV